MIHDGPDSGRDKKTGLMRREIYEDDEWLFDVTPAEGVPRFEQLKQVTQDIPARTLEKEYELRIKRTVFNSFNEKEKEIILGSFHKVTII